MSGHLGNRCIQFHARKARSLPKPKHSRGILKRLVDSRARESGILVENPPQTPIVIQNHGPPQNGSDAKAAVGKMNRRIGFVRL